MKDEDIYLVQRPTNQRGCPEAPHPQLQCPVFLWEGNDSLKYKEGRRSLFLEIQLVITSDVLLWCFIALINVCEAHILTTVQKYQ